MPWSSTITRVVTGLISALLQRAGSRRAGPRRTARARARRCRRTAPPARGCRPGRARRSPFVAQAVPVVLHLDVEPGRAGSAAARARRWRRRAAAALVRPSWAMRYAARSTPGLQRRRGRPRRAAAPACRPRRPARPAGRARRGPAAGRARRPRPSVRSTPKSRRISASASRAVASTAARSAASAACSGPSRRRTAWVWMVTTLIEWDTMSCSSRAIRVRSSAAARAASCSRSTLQPLGAGDRLLGAGDPARAAGRRRPTGRRRTPARRPGRSAPSRGRCSRRGTGRARPAGPT